jgi:hypothetical protein
MRSGSWRRRRRSDGDGDDMAELKTKATKGSVSQFINAIADDDRRKDCKTLIAMMTKATKAKPRMWGPAIVGFGDYHYKYDTGREADWFEAGFSPRKAALTLYLMGGKKQDLLEKLGAHSSGVGCLYLKSLDDIHQPTLQKLIDFSVKNLRKMAKEKKQKGQET